MKYSLLLLLLAATLTSTAQIQRREPYTPKPKPKKEKKQHHPPKMVELGFDIGYYPIEYGDGSIERISLSSRTEKHIQLFGHAEYVSSIFRKDIGLGCGANFPIGARRSYFYPGVCVGYYFRTAVVAGGQIGYVGYVSDAIALHIEGGCRWGSGAGALGGNVFYMPIVAGIRICLD